MAYWLFKTEPGEYSLDDLSIEPKGFAVWDGIRNYQARNLLRDKVMVGDEVLIYHSACKHVGIAGLAHVVKAAYADPAQFDSKSPYFHAKSTVDNIVWYCVDVSYKSHFKHYLSLAQIKSIPELQNMALLKQARLSIQPVSQEEWQLIKRYGS